MYTDTTRRALLGGAGLASVALIAPAAPAAMAPTSNSAEWDAAKSIVEREARRDAALDARHSVACADGTITDALEQEWSDSTDILCTAQDALFATLAPNLLAVEWKLQMLADRDLIDDDLSAQLLADMRHLRSGGHF
jgi:hypothetical protein